MPFQFTDANVSVSVYCCKYTCAGYPRALIIPCRQEYRSSSREQLYKTLRPCHTMHLAEFNITVIDFGFVYVQKIKYVSLVLNGVEFNKLHHVTRPLVFILDTFCLVFAFHSLANRKAFTLN